MSDDAFQQSVRRKWLFLQITAKILRLISTNNQVSIALQNSQFVVTYFVLCDNLYA